MSRASIRSPARATASGPGYNNLSLTVKRVTADHDGGRCAAWHRTTCATSQVGDTVQVIGPFGNTFLMPNHPRSHLVMICTGTGSAPMRAMTEWRRRLRQSGKFEGGRLLLFFGARTQQELPYFGPLMSLPKDFIDVNLAFSRTPGEPKRYVQDADARARPTILPALLADPDAYFFVCGIQAMEQGVLEALRDIATGAGHDWAALAAEMQAHGAAARRDLLIERDREHEVRRMKFADLHAGQVLETGTASLTDAEIVAFARDYDPQWFHTDPARAQRGPFGGLIASGWQTCGIAMRLAAQACSRARNRSPRRGSSRSAGRRRCAPATCCALRIEVLETRRSRLARRPRHPALALEPLQPARRAGARPRRHQPVRSQRPPAATLENETAPVRRRSSRIGRFLSAAPQRRCAGSRSCRSGRAYRRRDAARRQTCSCSARWGRPAWLPSRTASSGRATPRDCTPARSR